MSEPVTDTQRRALADLEYSEEWLSSGVLDRERLAQQHERFTSGGTQKTSRYRAQTVSAWLEDGEPLDTARIDAFIALLAGDPDPKLAQSSVAELIQSPRIDLDLLDHIAKSDPKLLKKHEALIRRTYLERRLEEGVTDELIRLVLDARDAAIQTRLIRDSRVSRKQAETLAKQGANPTLREKAQAWVLDKKAWK